MVTDCTVGVAQVVERLPVEQGAVGSSPITHPTNVSSDGAVEGAVRGVVCVRSSAG